jgi:hypothetical protein
MKHYALMVGLVAALVGCGGGGGSSAPASPPVATTPPAPVVLPTVVISDSLSKASNADALGYEPNNASHVGGEYVTNTGVWGVKAASTYTETFTGTIDPNTGIANLKVAFDVTPSATPGVVMYPNITYGQHPGNNNSTTSKLPAVIGDLGSRVLTADVTTVCETTCLYNTTVDMFVSSTKIPGNTGTEIMINLDHKWSNTDAAVGTLVINGVTFKVFRSQFSTGWQSIVYEAPADVVVKNLNINVKDILQDAVNRGYIKSSDYLASIELGSEVASGKGSLTISNFKIN